MNAFRQNAARMALSAALLLAGCGQLSTSPAATAPATQTGKFVTDPAHSYLTGQVVVGLESGVEAGRVAALLGGRVLRELPQLRSAVIALPGTLALPKAVSLLRGSGLARYAEPNLATRPAEPSAALTGAAVGGAALGTAAVSADPEQGRQWFLSNMGAVKAWDTATGKGVRIAVADEDIDRHHPDLAANMVYPGYDAPNGTLITADTPYDGTGEHGTLVAGTAAAVGGNGLGGAGVAPEASIVPLTITHDSSGASNVDSALAFLFAVDGPDGVAPGAQGDTDTPAGHNGYADVVNYSFGGSVFSQLSQEAINYVLGNGVIFVTSAGNTPTTGPAAPAWVPGVISVAATTPQNARTNFSNMGSHLSVAAPGENMWVTARRQDPQNAAENSYEYVNGTSFAGPATAAAAALVLQASAEKKADGSVGKITLTPAQVRHILEDTAYKPSGGYSTQLGNGIVRADAAVTRATQDAANTVEKGASISMRFVVAGDPTVGVPLTGVTLSGGGRRPDQLLYGQSAAGDVVFSTGFATFQQIDAGIYKLYASGPRTVLSGVAPGSSVQTVVLEPGDDILFGNAQGVFPLNVVPPADANEPNDAPAQATAIAYGQLREGVLAQDDLDLFRFTGAAGEEAYVNAQAVVGNADLKLSVLDAGGRVLASNGSFREDSTDAALLFKVPVDGTYFIQVEGENTGSVFNTYRLALTRNAGSETEPNGSAAVSNDTFSALSFAGANALPVGTTLAATLGADTDVDVYAFAGTAGAKVVALVSAAVATGEPDTLAAIYDASGKLIARNDDGPTSQDSVLEATLPADGTYFLVVGAYDAGSRGDYRVSLVAR
ncbi:S8 family serine peptidase [Deinococcus petrolearius]|uniref:S8 family serine peptidase n=1 Tax=Deinococcus petrolearius TaxID=1751295 RepID=A0ABW1DNG9_9DEIO